MDLYTFTRLVTSASVAMVIWAEPWREFIMPLHTADCMGVILVMTSPSAQGAVL